MKKLLTVVNAEQQITVANEIIKVQTEVTEVYQGMIRRNVGLELTEEKIQQPTSTLNPDGKSRACQCGARHTSRPDYHMSYCDMRSY